MVKQQAAAAAIGGVYALTFLFSGALMMVAAAAVSYIGLGPLLSALAVLHLCVALSAFVQIVCRCSDEQQMPAPLFSRRCSKAWARSAAQLLSHGLGSSKDAAAAPGEVGAAASPEILQAGSSSCSGTVTGGSSSGSTVCSSSNSGSRISHSCANGAGCQMAPASASRNGSGAVAGTQVLPVACCCVAESAAVQQ